MRSLVPSFIGRQPIFDRALSVHGYELLYRSSFENRATFSDVDAASAEVGLAAFLEFGLDTLVSDRFAFVNVTRGVLLSGFCRQLPADRVVLELLEDVVCDDLTIAEVRVLAKAGYRIALDDFMFRDELATLLPFASIVKLDISALPDAELRRQIAILRPYAVRLVAERVETRKSLDYCRELGFEYFQGYFFARPSVHEGRRVPVERMAAFRVLALLADDDSPLSVLAEAVAADVKLSYQVMRLVNSAYGASAAPVDSLTDAIVRLGRERLRGWVSVMALSGIAGKPPEVLTLALLRARMCERLAASLDGQSPGSWFTAGLFSALDLVFDTPLPNLLAALPLGDAIVDAVVNRRGLLGQGLAAVLAYEHADWDHVCCGPLTPPVFNDAYRAALQWTREWQTIAPV